MASIRPPEYPFADGPSNTVWAAHVRRLYDALGDDPLGQSTGDNIGQADIGLEWANTTDPIETLRLFCSADLVAGSRFTVLGRR